MLMDMKATTTPQHTSDDDFFADEDDFLADDSDYGWGYEDPIDPEDF